MKILYAIQGTGNGHLSRAREIIPALLRKGVDLDILVSGTQADVQIPYPVTYQFKGLSFIFGKRGGVDLSRTFFEANSHRLQREINSLPIQRYDLVINDFEPVSAWACRMKSKPCISLSHQAAVLAPAAPKPDKPDPVGKFILKNYAPATESFGFHFRKYGESIFTPVIRKEIREIKTSIGNHYTVYLPSYSDEKIINILSGIQGGTWQVFSKHTRNASIHHNIYIRPISNDAFIQSMATSKGVLCGAGFETPAEALYLHKKLLVIPMKRQYEQQCNMASLREMGVAVVKSLKSKHLENIQSWVDSDIKVMVDYPDLTENIIDQLLERAGGLAYNPLSCEVPAS